MPRRPFAHAPERFLRFYLAGIAVAAGLVLAAEIVIDPYDVFRLARIEGINAQKPRIPHEPRLAKAYGVCRIRPKNVILGSSRAEIGIDPQHEAFAERPGETYNLALSGAGIWELEKTLEHAQFAADGLDLAVAGLDFFMFNGLREAIVFNTEVFGFDEKRLLSSPSDGCFATFVHDLDNLLGRHGIKSAWQTVIEQIPPEYRQNATYIRRLFILYDPDGFRGRNHEAFDWVLKRLGGRYTFDGQPGNPTPALQEWGYLKSIWRPGRAKRYCFDDGNGHDTIATFRAILDFARAHDIDLRLYITPIHARMLFALHESGLWPAWLNWRRRLVATIEQEARESGGAPFALWDFADVNTITQESVPPDGEIRTLKWFWEPSHIRRVAGDLILDRILDHRSPGREIPDDFGVRLTGRSVEAHLERLQRGTLAYAASHPGEAARVRLGVARALKNHASAACIDAPRLTEQASAALAAKPPDTETATALLQRARLSVEQGRARYAALGLPYHEEGTLADIARVEGNAFDAMGRSRDAHESWRRSVALWPYQRDLLVRLVDRATGAEDYRAAAAAYGVLVEESPADPPLRFLRGVAFTRLGDYERALADFRTGLEIDPTNVSFKQLVARFSGLAETRRIDEMIRTAQARLQDGANQDALRLLNEVVASGRIDESVLYLRATANRALHRLDAADADFTRAIGVAPKTPTLYVLRGVTRLERGDVQGAIRDLSEAIDLAPDQLHSYLHRAAAYLAAKAPAKAQADYSRAVALAPDNLHVRILRGELRERMARRAGALADYEAGLEAASNGPVRETMVARIARLRKDGAASLRN